MVIHYILYSMLVPTSNKCTVHVTLQDWAANYWVQSGCPKHKLVIGMGLYGRTFTLKDPYQNGLMAPVKGAGKAGKYTREKGFLAYYEVISL